MSSRKFVWAINKDTGELEKCTASEETRGSGRCNHIAHQTKGQTDADFFKENSVTTSPFSKKENKQTVNKKKNNSEMSQVEIDDYATKIDEICGTKVTMDNYEEVLKKLSPKQLDALNKIGFETAPGFALPISDEHYEEEKTDTNIYFSDLPNYGIGGKVSAIKAMFGSVGNVITRDGDTNIVGNYKDGLSDDDYFEKIFSTRASQINKTVSVSVPGVVARQLWYGLSDIEVIDDCGGDHSHGVMNCRAPGVCCECAKKSKFKVKPGQLIGSMISTQLTEGLTQASLDAVHGSKKSDKQEWEIICDTLKVKNNSPIIQEAKKATTTSEARNIIFDGLKKHYDNAGINVDNYNLELVAKQITSFKRDKNGIRRVKDGELCDFPSMKTIGGHNNLFLQSELSSPYNKFTKPSTFENERTSVTEVMR